MSLLLLVLACAAGVDDADYDGFAADVDCDDTDALVYPGAPDAPADGVDADCDGIDPQYAFVGDWQVVDLSAIWSGQQAFLTDTGEGGLFIGEDMSADLDVSIDLDPNLAGQELRIDLVMAGEASAVPGDGSSWVWLEGDLYGEQSSAEWECVADEDWMSCEGIFKALDVNFLAVVELQRG